MIAPRLNCLGRALPGAWQEAIVRRSRGLDLRAIASDLFLHYPPDDRGLDPVTTKRQFFVVEQLVARYFRATTMGAENIPEGRVVIVASHSGVMAWDAMLLVAEIRRLTGRFSRNAGHEPDPAVDERRARVQTPRVLEAASRERAERAAEPARDAGGALGGAVRARRRQAHAAALDVFGTDQERDRERGQRSEQHDGRADDHTGERRLGDHGDSSPLLSDATSSRTART